MNKKNGYTIAGITAAIIAACSFLPAPDDNPPLASQPAPQATTANTEWTPKPSNSAKPRKQPSRQPQSAPYKQNSRKPTSKPKHGVKKPPPDSP